MNITIEKASPADAAALLAFTKQIGGETDHLTFGAEGLPLTEEAEAAYVARMENSTDDIMLVAKDQGKIVGTASLNRLPRRMRHRGNFAVSVAKAYWNQGIGSRLLSYIIEFAKENHFDIIDLEVRSDNFSAIHLYEKFGFQKYGQHPAFFKIRNQKIPFDYMYLSLL